MKYEVGDLLMCVNDIGDDAPFNIILSKYSDNICPSKAYQAQINCVKQSAKNRKYKYTSDHRNAIESGRLRIIRSLLANSVTAGYLLARDTKMYSLTSKGRDLVNRIVSKDRGNYDYSYKDICYMIGCEYKNKARSRLDKISKGIKFVFICKTKYFCKDDAENMINIYNSKYNND